jgi:hypothetical protein
MLARITVFLAGFFYIIWFIPKCSKSTALFPSFFILIAEIKKAKNWETLKEPKWGICFSLLCTKQPKCPVICSQAVQYTQTAPQRYHLKQAATPGRPRLLISGAAT